MNRVALALAAVTGVSAVSHACEPIAATIGLTAAACTPCGPELIGGANMSEQQKLSATRAGEVLTADVRIQGFAFDPTPVIIPVDAGVRWTNFDFFPHTSTSSAMPAIWDSDAIANGASYQRVFDTIGGFAYECIFHFGMNGEVTVRAPGDATGDNAVNISDFAILAGNFNQPGNYNTGDFNLDAQVNIGDFAILAANFNQTFPTTLPRGAAVPEPVAGVMLAVGAILIRRRLR